MKKSIIVFCAHPDDDVIGLGGTMAKYAEEGCDITVIIFSYGEMSHMWLKRRFSAEMRVKEAKQAHRMLGFRKEIFLGMKEGNFPAEIRKKRTKDLIRKLVMENKPEKVFTHSANDPHPDHQSVNAAVLDALKNAKTDIYTFDIWNPINLTKRNLPRLYIDISKTMKKKVAAIRLFKSQHLFYMVWVVYFRNFKAGLDNRCRFAEIFYKVK